MPGTLSEIFQVRLSPETKNALDHAAARDGRPASSLARVFIRRGLGEVEGDGKVAAIVKAYLGGAIMADEAMTNIVLLLLGQDWIGDDGDA